MENALEIEQLSHRYAKSSALALDDISFRIPEGSCFGLLGPNGAGKTTLLSILTGLVRPQAGSVRVHGYDLTKHSNHVRSQCSLVPQDFAFYPQLTGLENLRFFGDLYSLGKADFQRQLSFCLESCRLDEALDQKAEEYSGGMKRRLNLAIGLLRGPRILFLDEPTVGIDALSRQIIVEAIGSLKRQGVTIVYTSHYMEEIEAICDRLAIIDKGKLVACEATARLLQREGKKSLLIRTDKPFSRESLEALQAWQPILTGGNLCAFTVEETDLSAQLSRIENLGYAVEQAQFGVSRLEQIYLEILQGKEAGKGRELS